MGKTPIIGVHLRDQDVSITYNGNMHGPWHSLIFKDWIEHYADHFPDMDIAFNSHDESPVVVPHDELERSLEGCPAPQDLEIDDPEKQAEMQDPQIVYFDWLRRHRTWDRMIESCPLNSASRSRKSSEPDECADYSDGPLFIQDITRAKNVCEETDAASLHGFFTSPDGFVLTNSLVPVFTKSKASSFQDVLLPTVDYDSNLSEEFLKNAIQTKTCHGRRRRTISTGRGPPSMGTIKTATGKKCNESASSRTRTTQAYPSPSCVGTRDLVAVKRTMIPWGVYLNTQKSSSRSKTCAPKIFARR